MNSFQELMVVLYNLCVPVGFGYLTDMVPTAKTSDSNSENNLLNYWEETYISNKSAMGKGPPSLQHTQYINQTL